MTEGEAFQFLSKCERCWLWKKGLTPGQIIAMSRNTCYSIVFSSIGPLIGVTFNYPHDKGVFRWFDVAAVGFAVTVTALAAWMIVRLSEVSRALAHGDVTH